MFAFSPKYIAIFFAKKRQAIAKERKAFAKERRTSPK
jgi:hypothetical protein